MTTKRIVPEFRGLSPFNFSCTAAFYFHCKSRVTSSIQFELFRRARLTTNDTQSGSTEPTELARCQISVSSSTTTLVSKRTTKHDYEEAKKWLRLLDRKGCLCFPFLFPSVVAMTLFLAATSSLFSLSMSSTAALSLPL